MTDDTTTSPTGSSYPDPDAPVARAGFSRRGLLTGIGAVAGAQLVCPMAASAAPTATPAATTTATGAAAAKAANKIWKHAVEQRGLDVATAVGRSQEGRFGVMFKKLDAYAPDDTLLTQLAQQMTESDSFAFDNPQILAGFTFLGQFIDHDMTLDRTPIPQQQIDPHGLTNFNSPAFDLGSLYGGGPSVNPEFYESDGKRLKLVLNGGRVLDLPRDKDGNALIGDSRNDENLIVAQLHILFIKFHNRCLTSGLAKTLAEAQQLTRWHFQWIIVHDYLVRVCGQDRVDRFLSYNGAGKPKVSRDYYKPKNPNRPMMPIEYSAAAFRFGHSMVRAGYLMNTSGGGALTFAEKAEDDLRGSRPLPANLVIDWQLYFDGTGQSRKDAVPNASHRIDARLSFPLFSLPPTVVGASPMVSLAQRNLFRGKRLGLPSGQAVAKAMGTTPLSNQELGLADSPKHSWGGQAPLWYYILKESELREEKGLRLGEVGSRLVCEVILGILDAQKGSYFNASKAWKPPTATAPKGHFLMGDLVKFATGG